jgi:hypothetical protein
MTGGVGCLLAKLVWSVARVGPTGCGAPSCLAFSSTILAWACPPPQRGSLDGDLQRFFAISGLLYHHFSRQDIIIGGDSALFTDDHVLAFGHFSLFRSDPHLGVLQINGVDQKRISIHLHLPKTQSSFINGRLDLSTE